MSGIILCLIVLPLVGGHQHSKEITFSKGIFTLANITNKTDIDYTFSMGSYQNSKYTKTIKAHRKKTVDRKIINVAKNVKSASFDLMPNLQVPKSRSFLQRSIMLISDYVKLSQVGRIPPSAEPVPDIDVPVEYDKDYEVNLTITPDYSVEIEVVPK